MSGVWENEAIRTHIQQLQERATLERGTEEGLNYGVPGVNMCENETS